MCSSVMACSLSMVLVPEYQMSTTRHCYCAFSSCKRESLQFASSHKRELYLHSDVVHSCINKYRSISRARQGSTWFAPNVYGWRGSHVYHYRKHRWERFQMHAELDVASAIDVINDLGFDTLTFLAVTVLVVPAFRILKASPILGFFCAGVILNQFGLIRNLTDVKVLSEWGILFLLFEMGLELSLARLKALAKFAFGLGLSQVLLSTLAFTAFELPPNGAIGTKVLEFLFHSRPDLK